MAKPKRTFSADEGQFSKGTAGPDQIEYDLDNAFSMFDPNALLKDGSAGGIGPENLRSDYQVDQTQSPSSNTGRLDILLGRIANRIRAILGGTNPDWKNDPVTTLTAVKAHMEDATKHSGIASIEGIANPGGDVDLVGGVGIAISANPTTKQITITATGSATPAAHASSHAEGGADPVTPASIGAETPTGAQSKIDTHAANASAHHARYTDAEAVAAIKAADGAGSGLDADYLRGQSPVQIIQLAAPPGAIMAFARSTPPTGWLECNGQLVSRTTYADLFAAIGTTFGSGDGLTTFKLPDLRGEFIRGWDHGRGVDANRAFGSAQADELKAHTHTYSAPSAGYTVNSGSAQMVLAGTSVISTGSTGGAETRPRNVALMYCIKY